MSSLDLHLDKEFINFIQEILDKGLVEIPVRTPKQGQLAAKYLSGVFAENVASQNDSNVDSSNMSSGMIDMAINELMINAIEHGILKISYNEKTKLLETNQLHQHFNKKLLTIPENILVKVNCQLDLINNCLKVIITDPGEGFTYNENDDPNKFRRHGRGYMLAKSILPGLKYLGKGNQVTFNIPTSLEKLQEISQTK